MRHEPIDNTLFIDNRKRLAGLLEPGTVAIVNANEQYPASADATLPYHPNTDLFYLTGIEQEETVLLLFPAANEPKDREVLFIRETSELLKVWEGEKLSREKAAAMSGIGNVRWLGDLDRVLHRFLLEAGIVALNANEHARADAVLPTRDERFGERLHEKYPLHQYSRLAPLLTELRSRKSAAEVDLIRRAVAITESGFRRVLDKVRPGVAEHEIEAEFAHEFIRKRASFAFEPIVASGASSCILHYLANDQTCGDGDLLLLDIGAKYANYNADVTRTIPVGGRFSARQREVYDAVLGVLRAMIQAAAPGKLQKQWQQEAEAMMDAALCSIGLLSQSDIDNAPAERRACRKYFMHGIGHPLGLDVHDVTPPNAVLKVGSVMTVEPGIYIPGEQIGIRLENDIWISENGPVDLCSDIPIEADEIERLMAARS